VINSSGISNLPLTNKAKPAAVDYRFICQVKFML